MGTKWEDIYKILFDKIEKDDNFFNYNNVSTEEALTIAKSRAKSLLLEAIARITLSCTPDVDFNDYDLLNESFNFDCTPTEMDLLASIQREKLFDRDKSLLSALKVRFSPKDINTFSPAEERKSFLSMSQDITKTVDKAIDDYKSRDRLTGKLKSIDYASYELE